MSPDLKDDTALDDKMAGLEDETPGDADAESGDDETPQRMDLSVSVESPTACQRHVTVTIPRSDIDRYHGDAVSGLMGEADVPGFRAGRAPRKLVEARFRKEVDEQIKSSL